MKFSKFGPGSKKCRNSLTGVLERRRVDKEQGELGEEALGSSVGNLSSFREMTM